MLLFVICYILSLFAFLVAAVECYITVCIVELDDTVVSSSSLEE